METPVALQRTVRDDFSLPSHPESTNCFLDSHARLPRCSAVLENARNLEAGAALELKERRVQILR